MQVFLVQGIATGALARAVGDNYLGKKTGILDAYRGIGRSWISLVGALLLLGILSIIVMLWWVIVPCIGWFTGLGMIVFLETKDHSLRSEEDVVAYLALPTLAVMPTIAQANGNGHKKHFWNRIQLPSKARPQDRPEA